MRFALVAAVTLALSACSDSTTPPSPVAPAPVPLPPAPPPQPVRAASVWVVVLGEASGACAPGVTVAIVGGQAVGRTLTQADSCSYWDPDYDAVFTDLIPGDPLTLRASAPGYRSADVTVTPTAGSAGTPVTIELSPAGS